ncbi:hypothetical protein J2Y58_001443 [Sphingomonas sp. BE138]|uniref:hypothetical protein n=1 Tax=Sphingomonas sp. BE138 TaxID=2817845 RepID=UPI002865EAA5|nr:hypothetical protein [Sphingomonas sp. BE138]MDR6788085.1 hypothetical protein [Sphingomonas sp. BE138]
MTWTRIGWRGVMWSTIAALLLLPGIAMQVTQEVNWGPGDFAAAALLLAALGITIEAAVRLLHDPRRRTTAIILSALATMTIWAQAAVGVW